MKLGIMQPYFFPYIGYFQLIKSVDRFIFYDDVSYIKQGWINRNRFLINGSDKYFSVPLKNISSFRNINETEADNEKKWRGDFIKLVKFNYSKAPFFKSVLLLIETLCSGSFKYISEIAETSVELVTGYLQIKTEMCRSAGRYGEIHSSGPGRIIDICLKENADEYINPIGGQSLYSKSEFKNRGIELKFLKSRELVYGQFRNEFVPWLSIIDVLMFNSPDSVMNFLEQYELT